MTLIVNTGRTLTPPVDPKEAMFQRVKKYSCARCAHFKERHGCIFYNRCKANRPLGYGGRMFLAKD